MNLKSLALGFGHCFSGRLYLKSSWSGAYNMAILRHMAVNLLKQEKTGKGNIEKKRVQAAWDNKYLVQVLSGSM